MPHRSILPGISPADQDRIIRMAVHADGNYQDKGHEKVKIQTVRLSQINN